MPSPAQRLMGNPAFSQIYEHLWRPVFTRGFSLGGSSTSDYDRTLRTYLARRGDRMVLDIACGPGNHSEDAARGLIGDGQYVGIDFAASMVAQAQRDHRGDRISYLRGDAHHLPFPEATFDTVVCLAALYLIPDPLPVLDEMARVVKPGGEVIIFASVRASVAAAPGAETIARLSGLRIFGRRELLARLESLGMEQMEQTITGIGQYVHARRPR